LSASETFGIGQHLRVEHPDVLDEVPPLSLDEAHLRIATGPQPDLAPGEAELLGPALVVELASIFLRILAHHVEQAPHLEAGELFAVDDHG
jgi:hypothetical protein